MTKSECMLGGSWAASVLKRICLFSKNCLRSKMHNLYVDADFSACTTVHSNFGDHKNQYSQFRSRVIELVVGDMAN